jgi:hypothetical protein
MYGGCGGIGELTVTTGLSVGWGDAYSTSWFVETDDTNNSTCWNLKRSGAGDSVLACGPAA